MGSRFGGGVAQAHPARALYRSDYDEAALPPALLVPQWTTIESTDAIEPGVALLVKAIYTDFDLMQMHTALLVDADNWSKGGRSASRLLRGDVLRQAERWLAQTESANPAQRPKPTPLQVDYIRSGRRAARRRRAWSAALVSAALVIAVIAAFVLSSHRPAEGSAERP